MPSKSGKTHLGSSLLQLRNSHVHHEHLHPRASVGGMELHSLLPGGIFSPR